jgi:hypothetical protein
MQLLLDFRQYFKGRALTLIPGLGNEATDPDVGKVISKVKSASGTV